MGDKIAVAGIAKAFPAGRGRLTVFEDLSLTVTQGEFVAVVGPSGCGKTTLLNLVAGFERPDEGAVLIDGLPVAGPAPTRVVISQQGSVFPWLTVQRNLMIGLEGHTGNEPRRVADRYAAMVGLQGFERAYPFELSGGMLKRVEVARALAVRPEILLMDEPFAALDALTRFRMRLELRRILARERPTVLLVTHDVEEAIHLADRVVVLTARPAAIKTIVPVPIPHPRRLTGGDAMELKERILRELGVETFPLGPEAGAPGPGGAL
jgi:ABC-type nitrate/sulfonate/bicarbonate transport system ATPase subunit